MGMQKSRCEADFVAGRHPIVQTSLTLVPQAAKRRVSLSCLRTQVDIPDAVEPDEAMAARMKRQGDEAFVKGNFGRAVEAYTQALRHTTSDPAIWANRSAAFLRTGAAEDALQDARRARHLKPDYAKAGALLGGSQWM